MMLLSWKTTYRTLHQCYLVLTQGYSLGGEEGDGALPDILWCWASPYMGVPSSLSGVKFSWFLYHINEGISEIILVTFINAGKAKNGDVFAKLLLQKWWDPGKFMITLILSMALLMMHWRVFEKHVAKALLKERFQILEKNYQSGLLNVRKC